MTRLRLGILADTEQKLSYLKVATNGSAHSVYCSMLVAACGKGETIPAPKITFDDSVDVQNIDAWLVDVSHDEEIDDTHWAENLHKLLATDVPVVLSDCSEYVAGTAEHSAWLKRLKLNLQQLQGEINLQSLPVASMVWVLAASTGGPAAVKEFLQHLDGDLNIAFLYVQHIDEGHGATLLNMVNKESNYPAFLAEQGMVLQQNTITIVDPKFRTEILSNGTLLVHTDPWSGAFQPSIDQLVANLARTLPCQNGLIIFTGMGDDGAASCRLIKQRKGQVWVQAPASCVSASMPNAALMTDCVDHIGTPIELANALAEFTLQATTTKALEGSIS